MEAGSICCIITNTMPTQEPAQFLIERAAELVPEYSFMVLGEMHGSQQNAGLVRSVMQAVAGKQKPITVAFEWPLNENEQGMLRDYIQAGTAPTSLPQFFLDSDGRFTMEHAALLKWMKHYNRTHKEKFDITTFDTMDPVSDHEYALSQALSAYAQKHPNRFVVVETGNMHARTSEYHNGQETVVPMAAYLKQQHETYSVFIQYQKGSLAVEGQVVNVTGFESQQIGPNGYFDATLTIPQTEAAGTPTSLTDILNSM